MERPDPFFFGHGFVSAGASAYVGGKLGGTGGTPGQIVGRTLAKTIVGGTISKLTGGKFANGAATAAFTSIASETATAAKLHGGKSGSGRLMGKSELQKRLNNLRKYSEFSSIEEQVGKFNLEVDYTIDSSEYDSTTNTIRINPNDFNLEYKTDSTYFESGLDGLSDADYWKAIDSFPEYYKFSPERVIFHEANHALQDTSGLRYQLSPETYENPVIDRTNQFMNKHFNEPHRALDHNAIRIP